jgi:hypothetical protein
MVFANIIPPRESSGRRCLAEVAKADDSACEHGTNDALTVLEQVVTALQWYWFRTELLI